MVTVEGEEVCVRQGIREEGQLDDLLEGVKRWTTAKGDLRTSNGPNLSMDLEYQ